MARLILNKEEKKCIQNIGFFWLDSLLPEEFEISGCYVEISDRGICIKRGDKSIKSLQPWKCPTCGCINEWNPLECKGCGGKYEK